MLTLSARTGPRRSASVWVALACAALLLQGCSLLSDTLNTASADSFQSLKDLHAGFYDQFTAGTGTSFDLAAVESSAEAIEGAFDQAIEAAGAMGAVDSAQVDALLNLKQQFKQDAAGLMESGNLFDPSYIANLKDQVMKNYDAAIRGDFASIVSP